MNKLPLSAAIAAILIAAAPPPATARAMTEVDLNAMKRLGAPAVSPDGTIAVYQLTSTDIEANSRSTQLYRLDLTKTEAVPEPIADLPDALESSPAFAPDGSLYFISDKSGSDQIWRMAMPGGKPVQASDFTAPVAGFKLSPDGRRVAVWSAISKNCASFGCPAPERLADEAKQSGREYDEYFVRHWTSWATPGTYNRIFAFDLANGKLTGGGHALDRDVTGNAPTDPFGGGEEVNWSADGDTLFYTLRESNRNEPRSTDTDIYAAAADGSMLANLTDANQATDTMPTPSPDGRWLAYAAMARPGYESDRLVLMLRDLASGRTQALTGKWDRSVSSIAWAPDGSYLIVTAQDVLDHPAFMVALDGTVSRLTQRGSIGDTIALADGSMLYTKNSIQAPNDLFRMLPGGNERQLTAVNADIFAQIDPVAVERFSFRGADGDTVWGQVVKPVGAPKGTPTAYLVHGGPQGSFGDSWSFRWNPKIFASHGYSTVTVDFHGSTGYGQAFTDAINRDWGGKPLTDLKLGLAAAAKFDPSVTPNNACALGASYGGYMMNWFMGQWPGQFKCIVDHAGLFDVRAFYYSTEELWFPEWDFGGPYYAASETYEKWNPVNHVTAWKTPVLFTHGEKDFRIPYTQSLMGFTAAQRQGIPSRLVVFPEESHWINKPQNSIQWHRNVFAWLDKWTGGAAAAPAQ
ncbi:prolyl oligopeptidase family serine peptidase [Novosphingopyxis sp.]|uniref:dipeptidyl-peptidase 5 n=1 Tax=Novosphingopyxis sp. TaxID=2709690 RepID=UPI003B5A2ED2